MVEPTEADIGRGVIYTGNRWPGGRMEAGVITSFNNYAVFVRYDGDRHSKGTNREDLEWAHRSHFENEVEKSHQNTQATSEG